MRDRKLLSEENQISGNGRAPEARPENTTPEISVIIPTYNISADLTRCIDSIFQQKNVSLEVIIVDDCSTDDTRAYIMANASKYKEIKPVLLEKNAGPANARNVGLDLAKGMFIHFCDADDSVPEGAYEEMLRVAREEGADMVTGNYARRYPAEGNVVRPFSHYQAPTGFERCFESGNTTLWNKIYRRSIMERAKLRFNKKLRMYEDFLFFYQYLLQNPSVAYTDQFIYVYTEPQQQENYSLTNKIRYADVETAKCIDVAWRTLFEKEPVSHQELWRKAYVWNLSWFYNCSWRLIQEPTERKESYDLLKALLIWVQYNISFCDWMAEGRMDEFKGIFGIDYWTFIALDYEGYMMSYSLHTYSPLRRAFEEKTATVLKLSSRERDKKLIADVEAQILEIREVFIKEFKDKSLWATNYWNAIDCLVNDFWRLICDAAEKERLYNEIRIMLAEMQIKSVCCRFNKPNDVWRFCGVFGVDYATLQIINMQQYLVVCGHLSDKAIDTLQNNYREMSEADIATHPETVVKACRNGFVKLKTLIRANIAWLAFKLGRKKREE